MASKVQQLVNGHRDLTNAVSHELKTPLSRLRFALQMQQGSSSKVDKQKYTDKIQDNIGELESLINELLDYARLDRDGNLLKNEVTTQRNPSF
jgi:signal transduction histidine kinase